MNIRSLVRILVFIILVISLLLPSKMTRAEKSVGKGVQSEQKLEAIKLDKNALILAEYLRKFDSPLQFYAQDFIDAADQYDLDWRLVVAISGVESTFGKFTPGGYNGWGWGVYGTQAVYFNSWTDGIYTVSKGLRENYLNKGLTDPYSINESYATSPYWGWKVTYFMLDLEEFAQNYKAQAVSELNTPANKIAVVSGRLVLR